MQGDLSEGDFKEEVHTGSSYYETIAESLRKDSLRNVVIEILFSFFFGHRFSFVASLASGQSRPAASSFLLTLGSVSVDLSEHCTMVCKMSEKGRTKVERPDTSTEPQPSVNKKRAGRRPALTRHKAMLGQVHRHRTKG